MSQPAQRLPHVSPARLGRLRSLLRMLQALSPRLASRVAFWMFLRPLRRELRPADATFTATAKRHSLQVDGDRIQAYEWGTGSRTVLIVHGWSSRAGRFALLAGALVERGWRVLAFDAPGHGLSSGHGSSLPQFIATLDAVATRLGPVHALIGHSLGALAIACQRTGAPPAWCSSLQKVVLASMPSGVPSLLDSFLHLFGIGPATAQRMLSRFRRRFGAEPAFFVASADSAALQLPTLLVHDHDDDLVPFAHGAELLPGLANGRLLATDALGHSALTRDASTIRAIGDFLEGTP